MISVAPRASVRTRRARTGRWLAMAAGFALLAPHALGAVETTPTMNLTDLEHALRPFGLSIESVSIHNGVAGQFGTYRNFETLPVTIRPGVVLSSGDVTDLSPLLEALDPEYDPASPPARVNNQMFPEPETGGTLEFDNYGASGGNIENFNGSYDVAALRVDFVLEEDSPVKFDFIFGSVEFPYWTGQFTDAFLVFLDGFDEAHQITFDTNGNAVQVGSSFAGLETTADLNTAFANPHALIHHLTTTTERLDSGAHFIVFEVGDVNDHILDSVAFISNLRAEAGAPGTNPSEDCPGDANEDDLINFVDLNLVLSAYGASEGDPNYIDHADFNGDDIVDFRDLNVVLSYFGTDCDAPA